MRLILAMLMVALIAGCTPQAELNNQPQETQQAAEAMNEPKSLVNDDFKETSRVINVLYNDKLIIGDDRYMDIKSQLDRYEGMGIGKAEIPGLRVKLEALRVKPSSATSHAPANSDFGNLEKEINTIFERQSLISPEHLARINNDLNYFESQGTDKSLIDSLRKKVEAFNIPHPAPLNVSSNESVRSSPEIPSATEMQQLPECDGLEFNTFPVDMEKVYEISALGAIGPPGHTFPTEHSFIHLHATGTKTEKYNLYAPADVYITHVREQKGITKDPVDYTIYFALCKDIIGYFNHPKEISPEVQEILKDAECLDFGQENVCAKSVLGKVKAGTLLGKVGGNQGNFDFGLLDLSKTNSFANPKRYGVRSLHVQCPYEYYEESKKQKFFSLIKRDDAQKCGVIAQDIPGTLKGNWFYGEARADLSSDWDKHLAFVQESGDPGKQTVSIGGTVSSPKKITFTSQSGMTNPEFSSVMPDSRIHCFTDGSSKAIVQMVTPIEIKIEHKEGGCSASEQLENPSVYRR